MENEPNPQNNPTPANEPKDTKKSGKPMCARLYIPLTDFNGWESKLKGMQKKVDIPIKFEVKDIAIVCLRKHMAQEIMQIQENIKKIVS